MKRILVKNIPNFIEKEIKIEGWLYRVRGLKSITFLLIRDRSGLVQCVIENNNIDLSSLKLESVVSIVGIVKKSNNSLNPFEILVESFEIISEAHELPIELNKKELDVNLDTILNNRAISIRHEKLILYSKYKI